MTLSITTLRIPKLSHIMPNVIVLIVVMLSAVVLNVVVPVRGHHNDDIFVSLAPVKQGLG
jgi:hypothetical protein